MCPVVHIRNAERSDRACSGKCLGKCSRTQKSQRWVIAACDGVIAILRDNEGQLSLLRQGEANVSASVNDFWQMLSDATRHNAFDQLVIIGSPHDIAWVQSALPQKATKRVVAEIHYPLVSAWMRQLPDLNNLSRAVEQVLRT